MIDEQGSSRSPTAAAGRRRQVASWLLRMLGPSDLPINPSEEDLRLFLRDGNALCRLLNKLDPEIMSKVLSANDSGSNPGLSGTNSLRRFLKAVELLEIPLFEVRDLEQPNYQLFSTDRVVDCLLSLKSYYESVPHGRILPDFRNYDRASPLRNISSPLNYREFVASPSTVKSRPHWSPFTSKSPILCRRSDNVVDLEARFANAGNLQQSSMVDSSIVRETSSTNENHASNHPHLSTGTSDIHHISQKLREMLRMRTRGSMQDHSTSVLNNLENSSQSVSSLVNAMLGDKHQDEIPGLVEIMLKKLMEDFERRLNCQNEQVANLKSTLKEYLTREDKLAFRARLLETLAAGTGEEVKIVHSQLQKMKEEKMKIEEDLKSKDLLLSELQQERGEHQSVLKSLEEELLEVKQKNEERIHELEIEKEHMNQALLSNLEKMKAVNEEFSRQLQDLRATSKAEVHELKKRDEVYQKLLGSHFRLFQDWRLILQSIKVECLQMKDSWQYESCTLAQHLQKLAQDASGYYSVLAENRKLYNEVQDLKGNIRVYCRVRPFLPGQESRKSTVEFVDENGELLIANPAKQGKECRRTFTFNKAFGPAATQEDIFMDTRPLIRSVLDGYNVCIFAYGQTGSGKTYTMTGPNSLSEKDWGVNCRALNDLFQICQSRRDVFKYDVEVQMVEIYNEQVRDLLLTESSNKKLDIRNHSQLNGLNVPDAVMVHVACTSDVLELIKIGQKNRAVGATALNERSSRSHSVLTVHVQGTDLTSGSILHGCLHLVDLAGSERVDRSEATGERLKEAQHINKSLSALGDVISALAQKSNHIPYRNSKLTQLLQNSLAGQAKTLMFVHISPDTESYGETISTLKFAERVASVELGAARSNKESKEVCSLKEQVAMLREIIAKKNGEIGRLKTMQTADNDAITDTEKGKLKMTSNIHLLKRHSVGAKQPMLRRQTVDIRGHKLLTKRIDEKHQSQDADNVSSPPARKHGSSIINSDTKRIAHLKKQFEDEISDCAMASNYAEPGLVTKEKSECVMERQTQPNNWSDRIHSSTDSSLSETASLDDMSSVSESVQAIKPEPLGSDPRVQEHHHQSLSSDLVSLDLKDDSIIRRDVMQHQKDEAERPAPRELDTSSELSEGYVSPSETEYSLSSTAEQTSYIGRVKSSLADTRKPPRPRIQASKGEWRSTNLGQSHSFHRRHSAFTVTETTTEATGTLNSQNGSKTSKRWL